MKITEVLAKIQSELKAPKGQYNSFGKYKYRSCEDVTEAVKPLLKEHNCVLLLSDELVNIGERYYIKATVTLDSGSGHISVTGYAREEENKKGMDGAQITGAASSYARKYALNGLLAIDDTKDADVDTRPKLEIDSEEYKNVVGAALENGYTLDDVKKKYNLTK